MKREIRYNKNNKGLTNKQIVARAANEGMTQLLEKLEETNKEEREKSKKIWMKKTLREGKRPNRESRVEDGEH